MIRLLLPFTLCLTLLTGLATAQEICNNNIDDDGDGLIDCQDGECSLKVCEICDNGFDDDSDGFIDCYDQECRYNIACQGSFLTEAECGVTPETSPVIEVKLKYSSGPSGLANHVNNIVAGDIDGDGRTDLVTTYTNFTGSTATINKINAFRAPSSSQGTLSLSKSISVQAGTSSFGVGYESIAMGDINRDGCAEVFVITKNLSNESNFKIVAFDCNGTQLWTSPALPFQPGLIGLADFDHDGLVELYTRTQIYDAQTGTLLGQYAIDGSNWGKNSNAPVAVDILSNFPNLELVSGCKIYSVNINRASMVATIMLVKQLPQYYTRTARLASNPTSVADFNQDGYLDILATGSENQINDNTTIFFWDVQNNIVKKYTDFSSATPKGAVNGSGRISIADVDGDGAPNAVFVSGLFLYALKEGATGLERLWRVPIEEGSSGITGPATFDLDGDGKAEVVYRDENVFSIFTTSPTGIVTQSAPIQCMSRTQTENPVIVDLDDDGAAEICVICSTSTTAHAGKDIPMYDPGELRVYESANKPWLPARKVWNQHAYFVTNVNDDLTIPRVQQLHHLVFTQNTPCKQGPDRPYNAFMTQAIYRDATGCPSQPVPNLAITPTSSGQMIDYTPYSCLADSIQTTFRYTNRARSVINKTVQISFYQGDPTVEPTGATLLGTKAVKLSDMYAGDTITTTANIKNPGGIVDLYVVLNDNGSTLPLNLSEQSGHLVECDYSDNIAHATITPSPVILTVEVIQNDLTCITVPGLPTPPHSGEVAAYVLQGGLPDIANYEFYWFNGPAVKPVPDYAGPSHYPHLAFGQYTVYAKHRTVHCVTDTTTVFVQQSLSRVDARLVLEHALDDVAIPNGALRAVTNDIDNDGIGDPEDNFTYAWYAGQNVLAGETIGTNAVLNGLDAGAYAVLVTDNTTGCLDSAYATVRRTQIEEIILGTEDGAGVAGVSLYPNPGTESLTIHIDNGYVGDVHLQVQSVMGNEVYKSFSGHKGTKTLDVPVETQRLKPGIYLIKVFLGNKTTHRKWTKR